MRAVRGAIAVAACLALPATAADGRGEDAASALRVALPLAGLAATWISDDADGRRQWLWSTGTSLATAYALKAAISKERPNGNDNDAFPSGHATAAFAGASFIDRRYGHRYGWPAYAVASWVAWQRIDSDEHDTLDVLAGAALAVGVSHWLVSARPDGRVALDFAPGRSVAGLGVTVRFR